MDKLTIDFYELTISQAYFEQNRHKEIAYFDVFYRKAPDNAPFAIANGISEIMDFIAKFGFSKSDIEYLAATKKFSKKFLDYLLSLKFSGDVWAVPDGTVIFPNEPVITVRAPIIEAQLLETFILQKFNYASLITTKANRIVRTAGSIPVFEIGAKRAHGEDSAVYGAVYSYEAGAIASTCTETGKKLGVPQMCIMSHSFVQSFDSEYDAFICYAKTYPNECVLLVDTYNTLESGIVNAIKVYQKILKPLGKNLKAIRIDSGDLSFLAKQCRKRLDEAGMFETKIILSNSLDEFVIESLLGQGTPVDFFAVGERLITSKSSPIFGGVYKLVAMEQSGKIIPKIKISDNNDKVSVPAFKNLYRIYDENSKIISDYICMFDEPKPEKQMSIKDPDRPWLIKNLHNFTVRELRYKFISGGKRAFKNLTPIEIRKYISNEISSLPNESLRLHHPQLISINYSPKLTVVRDSLLTKRYR